MAKNKKKKSLFGRFWDFLKGIFGFKKEEQVVEEEAGQGTTAKVEKDEIRSIVEEAEAEAKKEKGSSEETESNEAEESAEKDESAEPEAEPGL